MLLYASAKLSVLVVSSGGVATTLLIEFLSAQGVRCNHPGDEDTLKHCPRPPISLNTRLKVIYLVGDPVAAVGSLFRRDYQRPAFEKLARFGSPKDTGDALRDLEAYAEAGRDVLMLDEHLRNWTKRFQIYRTLVLDHDDLWNETRRLLEFVGLPCHLAREFPPRRKRETEIPRDLAALLDTTYRPLRERIRSFGSPRLLPFRPRAHALYTARTLPLVLARNIPPLVRGAIHRLRIGASNGLRATLPGLHSALKRLMRSP